MPSFCGFPIFARGKLPPTGLALYCRRGFMPRFCGFPIFARGKLPPTGLVNLRLPPVVSTFDKKLTNTVFMPPV